MSGIDNDFEWHIFVVERLLLEHKYWSMNMSSTVRLANHINREMGIYE